MGGERESVGATAVCRYLRERGKPGLGICVSPGSSRETGHPVSVL